MRLPLEERRKHYTSIEEVLSRDDIDYTIHLLAGGEEIGDFEEYWLTNLPVVTRLLPVMLNATPESVESLIPILVNAVSEFEDEEGSLPYHVVLCGAGWLPEMAQALKDEITSRAKANLTVQSLDDFLKTGL